MFPLQLGFFPSAALVQRQRVSHSAVTELDFLWNFFLNRRKKGQLPFTPQLHVHSGEGFGVALELFSLMFVSLEQYFVVWQFYFLPQLFRFLFNILQNRKERIEAPAKNISRIKYSLRKIVEQLPISKHCKSRLGFFASFLMFGLWNSYPTLVRFHEEGWNLKAVARGPLVVLCTHVSVLLSSSWSFKSFLEALRRKQNARYA